MSVFVSGLVNLALTIELYGIDPAPLFAAENINIQFPVDPSLRIPFKKEAVGENIFPRKHVCLKGREESFGFRS